MATINITIQATTVTIRNEMCAGDVMFTMCDTPAASSNWLLSGGIWNDAGVWVDTAVWED